MAVIEAPRAVVRPASRPGGAAGLILPLILLVAWEACGRLDMLPRYLVAPSAILVTLWGMILSGEIFIHAWASLFRAGSGFLIGSFFGAAAGLAAGVMPRVERFYEPIISLTYPVPKIAILPIIFAWLGLGDASKIAVIVASVFYPTYIAAFYGAKTTSRLHVWSARNMGASRSQIFLRVVLPSALPQLFNGLRIGLGLSFIVMVTAELVTSRVGLGYLIGAAQDSLRFDLMYVAIIAIGVIGFAADRMLLAIRRLVLVGQLLGKDQGGG